jgi:hypothetical protein
MVGCVVEEWATLRVLAQAFPASGFAKRTPQKEPRKKNRVLSGFPKRTGFFWVGFFWCMAAEGRRNFVSPRVSKMPRGRQKKSTDPPVHLLNPRPTHPHLPFFFPLDFFTRAYLGVPC